MPQPWNFPQSIAHPPLKGLKALPDSHSKIEKREIGIFRVELLVEPTSRVRGLTNFSVQACLKLVDLDYLIGAVSHEKAMKESNAGNIQVIDSKESSNFEMAVHVIIVDERIGKGMRTIDESEVKLSSSEVKRR